MTDGDGAELGFESFRGRVVLLNIWATWCGPCVREMPALDRLQAELGGDEFQVLALSIDRKGRDVVAPFYERHGLGHLGMYFTSTGALRALGVVGLPTSFLIDREGRMLGRLDGPAEWDSAEAKALVRHELAAARDVHPPMTARDGSR